MAKDIHKMVLPQNDFDDDDDDDDEEWMLSSLKLSILNGQLKNSLP